MNYFIRVTKLPRKVKYIRYVFKISKLTKLDFSFNNGCYYLKDKYDFEGISVEYVIAFSGEGLNSFLQNGGNKTFKLLYLRGNEFGIRIIVDVPSQVKYLSSLKKAPLLITEKKKSNSNDLCYEIDVSITRSYFSKTFLHYDPDKPKKIKEHTESYRDISLHDAFSASDGIKQHVLNNISNYKPIQGGKCSPK